jgi:hypothetical protein
MNHLQQRLAERNIKNIDMGNLYDYARKCEEDTAIVIMRLDSIQNESDKDYHDRSVSNGDLVILIVRNHKPYTIMYRRSNQPLTAQAMRVNQVLDYTQ